MRATLAYTTARILLFVAAVGLIYLAGARGLLLFGLALLVSGAASYILCPVSATRCPGRW
jgi:Mn2+/Fe2+ NRAMP family transporter